MNNFNGSCWDALKRRLRESQAVILRAQEFGASPAFVDTAAEKARNLGWHTLFAPSKVHPDTCKMSAGVRVVGRLSVGLRWPPEVGAPEAPRSIIKVLVNSPEWPTVAVSSAHVKSAEGLGPINVDL